MKKECSSCSEFSIEQEDDYLLNGCPDSDGALHQNCEHWKRREIEELLNELDELASEPDRSGIEE